MFSVSPDGNCFHLQIAKTLLINTFKACLTLKGRMNYMKMLVHSLFNVVYPNNLSRGGPDSRFETF